MLDERRAGFRPWIGQAFNRKTLWQRSAIVAAGPVANLVPGRALVRGAHWYGIDEPKPVLGADRWQRG